MVSVIHCVPRCSWSTCPLKHTAVRGTNVDFPLSAKNRVGESTDRPTIHPELAGPRLLNIILWCPGDSILLCLVEGAGRCCWEGLNNTIKTTGRTFRCLADAIRVQDSEFKAARRQASEGLGFLPQAHWCLSKSAMTSYSIHHGGKGQLPPSAGRGEIITPRRLQGNGAG